MRIPAGVRNGGKIRLRGQGSPGENGGPNGDLLLKVHVREHPYFSIKAKQLHITIPVTPLELYQGSKIQVPTPYGTVHLTIPPDSKNGTQLRLRGKGLQKQGKTVGDLIAHLELRLPPAGDEKVTAALQTVDEGFKEPIRKELFF